jgi:hypothetical protein
MCAVCSKFKASDQKFSAPSLALHTSTRHARLAQFTLNENLAYAVAYADML